MKTMSVEFTLFIFFTYNDVTQQIQSKRAGHVAEAHGTIRDKPCIMCWQNHHIRKKNWLGFTQ